ncbi:MAG: histidine kinase [Salegentibacter sp.]|uniref:triple tyrosine motif-containing protein n=1 Tax=Salegentibacter sp. TaxID=1903072 RepID=UPI00286FBD53|nr:triple tyrosine motif-containing protein [Salegentibacter sp.]MDR9458346.1 histidine kinase [Salegentibacter sp.]
MRLVFSLLFLLFTAVFSAQELPPVINFNSNLYAGGNQNWMVSQAANDNIYVANSAGLLEYNGAKWKLYPVPNESVVRSVKVVDELIFTGAYKELGFWQRDGKGELEYTSLVPQFPGELRDGQQFWHIENVGETVIFHSFEGLYLYDIKSGQLSEFPVPEGVVTNLFETDGEIFYQVAQGGLFSIKNGKPEMIIPPESLGDVELMEIFREDKQLVLISREARFYRWNQEGLEQYHEELSRRLRGRSIFSALPVEDRGMLLGTVEDGIFHVSDRGEILHHFNQENGFLNNTVLRLFSDRNNNIWAALDNGLSVVNLDSPFKIYQDLYGKLGSVYTSFQNSEYLYLGTNQGLFYRRNGEEEFNFIEGSNGQVWNLSSIDGDLFFGHNTGTFLVEGTQIKQIAERFGTWIILELKSHPGYYIQGHYNGLSLLKRTAEGFEELPMLEGFPHSSKFIVSEENGEIWVGNEHKGVFRLMLNEEMNGFSEIRNYPFEGVSGISSSLFSFRDELYFATREHVFKYLPEEDNFIAKNDLAEILSAEKRISGKFVRENEEELWAFSASALLNITPDPLSSKFKLNSLYLSEEIQNITPGYENITPLYDGTRLLGIANGYLKIEKPDYEQGNYSLRINSVYNAALDEESQLLSLNEEEPFHYKTNNIIFNYSIPEYKKFLTPDYSYRLTGFTAVWSPWSEIPSAEFKNLPFGDYEFEVRARIGDEIGPSATYEFSIARPWYLSYTALIVYLLLFAAILYMVHKIYKRRHEKFVEESEKALRMKNLEAEQEIIKLQNRELEQNMASKNKELAVSTMSLIKKNEFLNIVKDRLKDSEQSSEVRSVIKTIDKEISEEDNWKFFKKAFSNADKDFFKKMKAKHPELTSNDLKLCAYLRLNLSSKEIAPLLNISVKSVEIKRYRLRKKMELPREVNLTDYILQV